MRHAVLSYVLGDYLIHRGWQRQIEEPVDRLALLLMARDLSIELLKVCGLVITACHVRVRLEEVIQLILPLVRRLKGRIVEK